MVGSIKKDVFCWCHQVDRWAGWSADVTEAGNCWDGCRSASEATQETDDDIFSLPLPNLKSTLKVSWDLLAPSIFIIQFLLVSSFMNKKDIGNFCEFAKIFAIFADWALSGTVSCMAMVNPIVLFWNYQTGKILNNNQNKVVTRRCPNDGVLSRTAPNLIKTLSQTVLSLTPRCCTE